MSEAMRWVVLCKNCGQEFVYRPVDLQHPRETVNNMDQVEPPKPPIRKETRICPHCGYSGTYAQNELQFRRPDSSPRILPIHPD